jgi:phosphomannomutase
MALTLEAMAVRNMTSTQLAGRLPRYHIVKQTINCPSARAYSLIRNLRNHFPDAEVIEDDGFKFIWHDGWISLRNAATEPVIRMISEWKTMDEALDRALRVRGLLERLEAL